MPCLDNKTGVVYSSLTVSGDVDGPSSVPVCANPAFHPTVVRVTAASLGAALAESWTARAITTDGTEIALEAGAISGSSRYFVVPAADLGEIAAIRIPPNPSLTDRAMTIDVWGYADSSLQGGDVLHDVAAASAYRTRVGDLAGTSRQDADLYLEANQVQLGMHKEFGAAKALGGNTAVNLVGSLAVPPAFELPGPVVMTDLLPADMTWANPVASAGFSVKQGLGAATTVTATVERVPDYEGSGRELVRASLPASAFAAEGFYTITPPTNFLAVSVPSEARTYNNTAELFVASIGRGTMALCGASVGTDAADLESSDPLDLDGDGVVEENYCQYDDELVIPGSGGPSFGLAKTVQGDLDNLPKPGLGVGNASPGGTGVYTLTWRNKGGKELDNPVVYDVMAHPGDTGITAGQASQQRGSEFATSFVEVLSVPAGVEVEYSTSDNPCRPEV